MSGGLEPCRCSRPARDAAPTIAPTIFCSDRLAADAGPGRRRSQLPRIQPDAFDAPDFVGIGAKPARQDGQRGRRNGRGGVLGHLAIWHGTQGLPPPFRRPLWPSSRVGFAPIPTKSGASRASGWICGSRERRRPGPAHRGQRRTRPPAAGTRSRPDTAEDCGSGVSNWARTPTGF